MDGSPPPAAPSIAPSETSSDSKVTPSGTTGAPATFAFPPPVLGKDEKLPPGFEHCTYRFTLAQPPANVGAFDTRNSGDINAMADSGKPHASPSVTHQPPAEPSPLSSSGSSSHSNNKKRAYRRKKAHAPSFASSAVATASDGNLPTVANNSAPIVGKRRRKSFPPMYYDLKGKVDYFPWLVSPQPCDRILITVIARVPKKPWIPPYGVAWSEICNAVHHENSTVFPTIPTEKALKGRFEHLMRFTSQYNRTHPRRSSMAESVKMWLDDLTHLQQDREEYIVDAIASSRKTAGRKRISTRQEQCMLGRRPPRTPSQAGVATRAWRPHAAASNSDDAASSSSSAEVVASPKQGPTAKQQIQHTVGLLEKLDETQRQFQAWLATATPPSRAERSEDSPIAASLATSPTPPTVGAAASTDGNTTTTTTNNNNNNNNNLLQLVSNQHQMMLNMNRHLEEDRKRTQQETSELRKCQMKLSSDVRSLVLALSGAQRTTTTTNSNNNNNNNDDNDEENSSSGDDDDGAGI